MKNKVRVLSALGVTSVFGLLLLSGCAVDVDEAEESLGETQEALTCNRFPYTANASLNYNQNPSNAIDGNTATRWESAFADNQEITVVMENPMNLASVTLNWEAACGKDYDVDWRTSTGAWQSIVKVRGNTKSGNVTHTFDGRKAKYVRMTGLKRCLSQYGFSLWEFSVGIAASKCYLDADFDGFGAPGASIESCNGCLSGRASNSSDCYDSNKYANPNATNYSLTHRGDGSFDWNCDNAITPRSQTGNIASVCTHRDTHQKTDDCSKCEYNFVPIDATDCGKLRCSLSASEYILCR